MGRLANKNILFIIPKDYYCEEELEPLQEIFKNEGATVKIASSKFKEAIGMRRGRILGVFHGVIVMGGNGSRRYLWDEKLVNLLLSDRDRSHMIIAAIGMGVPCLGFAGLIQSMEVTVCDDKKALEAIDKAKAFVVDGNIKVNDNIITAKDASAVKEFAEIIIKAVAKTKIK